MKKIFIIALLCAVPGVACSQDARMSYKTVSGDYASVSPVSTVCSVDANGVPQLCADGIAGGSVPVCGLVALCAVTGSVLRP